MVKKRCSTQMKIKKRQPKYISAGCAYLKGRNKTTMPFLKIGFNNNIFPEGIGYFKIDNRLKISDLKNASMGINLFLCSRSSISDGLKKPFCKKNQQCLLKLSSHYRS